MNESVSWRDAKYGEIFEQELRGLSRRRLSDPACTPEDLERTLKGMYIMDGADWYGRGDLQDTIAAATIAAYEKFIVEWRKERDYGVEGQSYSGKGSCSGRGPSAEG